MRKEFEVTYERHHIRVVNTWFNGERLYVDGKLQDENLGLAFNRAILTGVITEGDGVKKEIKVTLGGNLSISCRIFIDHNLIYPSVDGLD